MRVLAASLSRQGVSYVVALTIIVSLIGGVRIYTFENEVPVESRLHNYGTPLCWKAMLMTTMDSNYSPKIPEGRVLYFFLALYVFAIFDYVTATLAIFFIGRDTDDDEAELAGVKSIQLLQSEIAALRGEIQELLDQNSER
jgi:voltage-gated potassium channel